MSLGSYGVRVCQQRQMIRLQARPRVRSARRWSCPRAGLGVAVRGPGVPLAGAHRQCLSARRKRLLHAQRNFAPLRLPDCTTTGAWPARRRSRRGVGSGRGSHRSRPAASRHRDRGRGAEEAAEDLPVGMGVQRVGDLCLELRICRSASAGSGSVPARSSGACGSRSRRRDRSARSAIAPAAARRSCGSV